MRAESPQTECLYRIRYMTNIALFIGREKMDYRVNSCMDTWLSI